jgi:hypothetical protein
LLVNHARAGIILNHPNYWELGQGLVGYWSFDGKDIAQGETRQIWFTRDGNLFQVVMYSDNLEWLDAWARELPYDWIFSPREIDGPL